MRVPVFLDAQDIACCLAVPSVGDPVRWSLLWHDDAGHPAASEIRWASEQPLRLDEDERRHIGVESGYLLTRGPVAAWWRGAAGRRLPARGVLIADPHGFVPEAVPPIRGRAGEVSLLIGTVRETLSRHEQEVSDETSSWPIVDGQAWADWAEFAALAGPLPAGHRRRPDGVVVVVDVTP